MTGSPGTACSPQGNVFFVCDTPSNRVVWYDVYGNWSPESAASPSPVELGVLGQTSFTTGTANHGSFVPDGLGLFAPGAGAVNTATNELWIVDSGNNRVLVFPAQASLSYTLPASRVLGQLDYPYNSPNLIEGKEVWFFGNGTGAAAMVVDKNSNPPHLYVADFYNNRVLGFKDARAVGTDAHNILTQKADIVIGQPNLRSALVNYSTNPSASGDPNQPGNTGLNQPVGLAVDPSGNLYVADSGNGRVLRFPSPFAQAANAVQTASLVLGQLSFGGPLIKDPSPSTMNTPYGLALFYDTTLTKVTGLAVSDAVHNRVLIFQTLRRSPSGRFYQRTRGQLRDRPDEFHVDSARNLDVESRQPSTHCRGQFQSSVRGGFRQRPATRVRRLRADHKRQKRGLAGHRVERAARSRG